MNLFVDESVDRQIVDGLRQDGHVVSFVAEMEPGLADDIVLERANREGSVLVTADKDFGELVYRQKRVTHGIILIRLAGLHPDMKAQVTTAAIREHGDELTRAFTVIATGTVRIRRDIL